MKKFYKIAKRNVTTVKPYKEVSKEQFDECIMQSSYMEEQLNYIPEELADKLIDETIEKVFEKAYNEATEYGFDCGDYHLYISEDDDINEYDFERRN